jgi:hypothetical protein
VLRIVEVLRVDDVPRIDNVPRIKPACSIARGHHN